MAMASYYQADSHSERFFLAQANQELLSSVKAAGFEAPTGLVVKRLVRNYSGVLRALVQVGDSEAGWTGWFDIERQANEETIGAEVGKVFNLEKTKPASSFGEIPESVLRRWSNEAFAAAQVSFMDGVRAELARYGVKIIDDDAEATKVEGA